MKETTAALPGEFIARLQQLVPPAWLPTVEAAFREPRITAFRVNTLKVDRDTVQAALRAEGIQPRSVAWYADAFWVPPEDRALLLQSRPYRQQWIYVQDLSSMLPPLVLAPKPGSRVLDLCAAPGSKTVQLACLMQGQGEIAAVEVVRTRFYRLRANVQAQGAPNVRLFLQDGTRVGRYRPEYFDYVLVDAPCSSEGRFHLSNPETFAYWSLRKIREMARKQYRLLVSAVQSLRPGGVLVYATCTMAPEENEAVLTRLLHTFGDILAVEPIPLSLPNQLPGLARWNGRSFHPDLRHARRILPTTEMEGFFLCRLRKRAS
ncbi:RsmB/NOP family class I SAM-dependent RNA methyltransferase [Rhodothermus profundi]|uniref:16S rRNA (Cytosine1407-C5)-methyltransferase n=1 Tax=Rhodothermus profundi TaxID=633813 RepID=A0A1M6S127_9BACT|nr:RsmB/NOP family class I SAM-dependent RNA methyltransferase [Rhodothermus profundi]SHK38299.1 16S rRNA (cytosine1407-C5)-methyltransferase [Rhodothermus profundi]